VSNVGGCLTPIGDPPLFLGYLAGVPFGWIAQHCFPIWIVGVAFLLLIFLALDYRNWLRAPRQIRAEVIPHEEWRFEGLPNLLFLAVILAAVFIKHPIFVREAVMAAAAAGSFLLTRKSVHESNHFTFHPINEIAILFAGIFATMMPALDWLLENANHFGSISPGSFYWLTGGLSSVLDNAPTYLCSLRAALSQSGSTNAQVAQLLGDAQFNRSLVAISIAAVFFGACTYIGNGPNFMVKAIAEHQKVRVPGFIRYIACYTLPCVLPMLILVWWLFFRG
jgi:Na+/H+ antiporter NhaD/arsenite permease-like protein